MANPLIAVFNPITTLIDPTPSASSSSTPTSLQAFAPVVLNSNGIIDPSLVPNQGTVNNIEAGQPISSGQLVSLYYVSTQLTAELAWAGATGTAPSGGSYPIAAVGFAVTSANPPSFTTVQVSGLFTYFDNNAEFSASNIGDEVFLRWQTSGYGGITLTRPAPPNLQQTVGTVVGFTAPNVVQVAFVPTPNPPELNFSNISSGTNTSAIMTLGSGASLTFSGSGVVNANELTGNPVSATTPTTGQALIWSGSAWAPSSTFSTSFTNLTTGTNTTAGMTVGSGSSLTFSGSGVINVNTLYGVTISATPPTTGQVLTATSASTADWETPSGGGGTPAAPFTSVQFNNSGAFGGSADFVWDTTLTVSGFAPALAIGNNIAGGAPFPNSRINILDTFTTTTPSVYSGYQILLNINGSGDFTGTAYCGYEFTGGTQGSANYGSIAMWQGSYQHEGTGTVNSILGVSAAVGSNPSTGDVTSMIAVQGGAGAGANVDTTLEGGNFTASLTGGTALMAAGVEASITVSAPGVITTGFGVKVDGPFNSGTIGTYYGVYSGAHIGSSPSTFWAFYAVEGDSFFGDPVSIVPTNAGVALSVTGDAFTSDILDLIPFGGSTAFKVDKIGDVTSTVTNNITSPGFYGFLSGNWTLNNPGLSSVQADGLNFGHSYSGNGTTTTGCVVTNQIFSEIANDNGVLLFEGLNVRSLSLSEATKQNGLSVQADINTTTIPTLTGVDISSTNETGSPVTVTNRYGVHIQSPTGTFAGTTAAGLLIDDQTVSSTYTNIWAINYNNSFTVSGVGVVSIAPAATATTAALTVNDDGGAVNDIADFFDITGSYNVVAIGQPLSGNSAMTVGGDGTGTPTFQVASHIASGSYSSPIGVEISYSLSGTGVITNGSTNVLLEAVMNDGSVSGGFVNLEVYTEPGGSPGSVVDTVTGILARTQVGGDVTGVTEMISVDGQVYVAGSTVAETIGFYTQSQSANIATITTAYGVYADVPVYSGGTIGTVYGVYVADQTLANANPANYSIFVAGGPSVFAGVATGIVTKTTTYTATQSDHTINCNGTFTLTLPTTNIKVGQEFYIKNIGTGTITVSSSVNIDGATTLTLNSQYVSVTVQWDGIQWWVY